MLSMILSAAVLMSSLILTPRATQDAGSLVSGTLTYRERIALDPSAVIQVQLLNVSRADAPAQVLSEQSFAAGGQQAPFNFELPYDPAAIRATDTYAVSARITQDGTLLFVTMQRYVVLTRGAPSQVDLVLGFVGRPLATCMYELGFRGVFEAAPSAVGPCINDQIFLPNGDAVQTTQNGTLRWRQANNWTGFLTADSTWVMGPEGLQQRARDARFEWEVEPPSD